MWCWEKVFKTFSNSRNKQLALTCSRGSSMSDQDVCTWAFIPSALLIFTLEGPSYFSVSVRHIKMWMICSCRAYTLNRSPGDIWDYQISGFSEFRKINMNKITLVLSIYRPSEIKRGDVKKISYLPRLIEKKFLS